MTTPESSGARSRSFPIARSDSLRTVGSSLASASRSGTKASAPMKLSATAASMVSPGIARCAATSLSAGAASVPSTAHALSAAFLLSSGAVGLRSASWIAGRAETP